MARDRIVAPLIHPGLSGGRPAGGETLALGGTAGMDALFGTVVG